MGVLRVLSPSSDSDLAHFKSLKKFDGRVYFWYTLKQVSKIIFQNNEISKSEVNLSSYLFGTPNNLITIVDCQVELTHF